MEYETPPLGPIPAYVLFHNKTNLNFKLYYQTLKESCKDLSKCKASLKGNGSTTLCAYLDNKAMEINPQKGSYFLYRGTVSIYQPGWVFSTFIGELHMKTKLYFNENYAKVAGLLELASGQKGTNALNIKNDEIPQYQIVVTENLERSYFEIGCIKR